MSNML